MKRLLLPATLAVIAVTLAGCSAADNFLENKMMDKSGIAEISEYKQYMEYSGEGSLDQDGYYTGGSLESASDTGYAEITFAENAFLDISYYSDAELTVPVNMESHNFNEGDCIYADVSVSKSASSSEYAFTGFKVMESDESGSLTETETITPGDDGLLLQVTDKLFGKKLSLVPYGSYKNREITLKDTYFDSDENEHTLSGKWTVNDQPVSGNTAEISPISSYIISYEFDSNRYFYVSSEPESYYINNDDGIVIFNKMESTDETADYSVTLHSCISVELPSATLRYVTVDNGCEQEVKAGKSLEIGKLKYGDSVVLVTDCEWPELEKSRDLILHSSEKLSKSEQSSYRYTLVVPQKGGEFEFNPSDYTYEHGTVSFSCFGEEVTSTQYLAEGSTIRYGQCTAEDGYWLPDGDNEITVTTPEETRKALENISFTEKIQVSVDLRQPEYGGRIEYYANGNRIDSDTYKCDSGTQITMKFFPWEGWINKYNNGAVYSVNKNLSQQIMIDENDVSTSAFSESDEHKPKLTVVLDGSVGENMKFGFDASGYECKDYSYIKKGSGTKNGQDTNSTQKNIENEPIGTEKGITITMSGRAIQNGTAVKILVEKSGVDKSGNETVKVNEKYCRLVDSLTELQDPINIYSPDTIESSGIWYDSVKITISIVDIRKFTAPHNPQHGTVTVRNAETSEILSDGDILEGSDKVTVTISADNGYYVTGKKVQNGIFQDTMKFDKYLSEIDNIINGHSTEKYCKITLDSNDPYGTCVYKYDGKVVSGTVNVKPGDKIKIEYEITDPEYVIGDSGFLGIGSNRKKKTASVTIDMSYDGKTINRETFGIGVRKEA